MSSDYSLFLYAAAPPLGLLTAIAIAGRLFRRRVESSMELAAGAAAPEAIEEVAANIPVLQMTKVDVSSVKVSTDGTSGTSEARRTRRDIAMGFIAAGVVFTACSSGAIVAGIASLHRYGVDGPIAIAYMLQWVPLVVVLWVVDLPWRLRFGTLASYSAVGFILAIFASSWVRAMDLFKALLELTVLIPLAALIPLLIRRFRPWLLMLIAILFFLVIGASVVSISKIDINVATSKLWTFLLGAVYTATAVILVRWLLQRERWKLTTAGLGLLIGLGLLFLYLHRPDIGMSLLGLPGNVLQVLLVWAIFKGFVMLQERQLLPAQVLHSHLCWGVLTLYLFALVSWGGNLYGQLWWERWSVVIAYGLYLLVLHVWLHRMWRSRKDRQGRRLLLLRVFGKTDQRERLLDWLDDSWRFIGRIDLIAGTDLAERTLGARMLEAFLLRRTDQMFLRTPVDVDKRLASLRLQLEGDARYPVNTVYCYASAWREAVERLAPESDAVLMDLRGFSAKNRGCIFELKWIVQRVRLSKIVLLTDASTDSGALARTISETWSALPADSPSVSESQPRLIIAKGGAHKQKDGVFALLLNAAADLPPHAPGEWSNVCGLALERRLF